MTRSINDPSSHYLDRLRHLTTDLPAADRSELLASISEHLADAEARDELADALNRLGTPTDVAAAARSESGEPPAKQRVSWVPVAVVAILVVIIIGFTLLGAVMSITAWFDDDADWNVHPAVALAGMATCAVTGLLVSVIVITSRRWRGLEAFGMVGVWMAAMVIAVAGSNLAVSTPPGAGFPIAAGQALLGGLSVIATLALGLKAGWRTRA